MKQPTPAIAQVMPTAIAWFRSCLAPPERSTAAAAPAGFQVPAIRGFTSLEAKRPVRRAPSVPPTPWTPKASSESSKPNFAFSFEADWQQTTPAMRPRTIAEAGVTKPAAGVTTTRPATMPDTQPSALGLPLASHSVAAQENPAAAAAKWVAANAEVARPPAASAEPALKPNQPTHRSPAPVMLMTTLCGTMGCWGYPMRFPTTTAQTRAETPELTWTTVPPAKSSAGILPPRAQLKRPPFPQTMWASGK